MDDKPKIHTSSSNIQFVFQKLGILPHHFKFYSNICFKGTIYKKGYYLTNYKNEIGLFEILEIIIPENKILKLIVQKIQVEYFSSHYKSYIVDNQKLFF